MTFTDTSQYMHRVLDTKGDGTGVKNAAVDGSVTPMVFKLNPPENGRVGLSRMLIEIRGAGRIKAEGYGGLGGLTNGIQIGWVDVDTGALVRDFLDGVPIRSNGGFARVSHDVVRWSPPGLSLLAVHWSFIESGTVPILTPGCPAFGVRIRDDLSGLDSHYFVVQGRHRPCRV